MPCFRRLDARSLAVLVLLAGCAQEEVAEPIATYTLLNGNPDINEFSIETDPDFDVLDISNDGAASIQSTEVTDQNRIALMRKLEADGVYRLGVSPSSDTSFAAAVNQISLVNQTFRAEEFSPLKTGFVGGWRFRGFLEGATDANADALPQPKFLGPVAETELAVLVHYSSALESCTAFLDGEAVSFDELREKAFETLKTLIEEKGGIDAILADLELLEGVVARIRADRDTPWRCVGPALEGVKGMGWPEIRLEVMDNEEGIRSP